ncbi:MAG: AraC family transcriptional regulator ligand-binding domain-containing protein, partial [Woeseiaceae bacterium]|nr:AraC family transcriptional regulator ligand-binding domain-containing protein [Woeseiaceae bacterium]
MTTAYVNSTSLLDWQRTLGSAARAIESPCGQALARIGAAIEQYPERIPLSDYVGLLESIGERCRSSAIAWNVGLSVELPLGTDLGRAVLGCRSLGTALHWLCHYFPLLQDSACLRLDVEEDWTTLSYRIVDPTIWPRHEDAMYTLGVYAKLLKAAAPEAWSQVQVTVEAEQDQVRADLETIVDASVAYGGNANALRFPTSIINAPLNLARPCDPGILKKLSAELAKKRRQAPIAERTRQTIFREMNDGSVNQEHIARELGISSRTLRRRLAEEGHSFQG